MKRRRKNRIIALQNEEGQWIYDNDLLLLQHIIHFYSSLYTFSNHINYAFNTVTSYPCIRVEDRMIFKARVTKEEVKRALFSMKSYKSPGPDGSHPLFFKSRWEKLGDSNLKMVEDCFSNPHNIGNLNKTLITLIPKCDDPSKVNQLRPIALCNVSYKIISKIISNRIKPMLPYIVSQHQSSFIAGRSTLDNILLCKRPFTHLIS